MVWDITVPAGTEAASLGDDRVRTFKSDLQDALRAQAATGVEALFPGSDTALPVYRYRGLKGTTAARPASGQYGLYANETTNTLQRDNGTSWVDIATLIPSGTVMLFFQAAAPVGWTKLTTQNDKALRIVSGSGGGAGGTVGLSSGITLAHVHTYGVLNHVHKTPILRYSVNSIQGHQNGGGLYGLEGVGLASTSLALPGANSASNYDQALLTANPSSGSSTGDTGSTGTNITLAYVDVIQCSKD